MYRIAVTLLLATAPAWAAPNRSWDTLVQTATVGKKVVVTRMTGGKVEGKLLSITEESVTVERNRKAEVVPRESVFRFRYADIRKRNTFSGMGLGVLVGFLFGAVGVPSERVAAGTALAMVGVGIGAAVGGAYPIGEPLYEAERRTTKAPAAGK